MSAPVTEATAVVPEPPRPTGLPKISRLILPIAGLVALVQLYYAATTDFWLDEIYMVAAGAFHPSFGYVDQPPIAPLIGAAMHWLGDGSLLVLRIPAVLATAAGVVLTALIARELGGRRWAQGMAACAQASALWVTLAGHWVTPYTFEPTLWAALFLVLVRWIRQHREGNTNDRLLLVLGVLIGISAQTKFQVFLLCAVLLVTVLISGPRVLLRRPKFWIGAAIAVVIAAPTLVWQALNGWPQLAMGAQVAAESDMLSGGRSGTALQLVIFSGVLGTTLLLVGVVRLLFRSELRDYRFFGITFLVLLAFFVATAGRPYYLSGMYPVLFAFGALGVQQYCAGRGRRTSRVLTGLLTPVIACSLVLAGIMAHASGSMLLAFGVPSTAGLAQDIAKGYHAAPDKAHTAIVTNFYFVSAVTDVYSQEVGVPPAHSPNRGYGYFGPPEDTMTSILWVSETPAPVDKYFREVRPLHVGERKMWLCSGRTQPWSVIWAQERHL